MQPGVIGHRVCSVLWQACGPKLARLPGAYLEQIEPRPVGNGGNVGLRPPEWMEPREQQLARAHANLGIIAHHHLAWLPVGLMLGTMWVAGRGFKTSTAIAVSREV